jgi:hypothetical protein
MLRKNRQNVRKGVCERVKQAKRPRGPRPHDAGGKSVSEKKSQVTRTRKNLFEKCTHQEYLVDVGLRRMSKKGVEFLIGWGDFPNIKYDTWEPITNLPGSEHMITVQEFPRLTHMVRQYLVVPASPALEETLQQCASRKE